MVYGLVSYDGILSVTMIGIWSLVSYHGMTYNSYAVITDKTINHRRTVKALFFLAIRKANLQREPKKTAEVTNNCGFECVPFFLGSKIEPKKNKKLKLKRKGRCLSCGG